MPAKKPSLNAHARFDLSATAPVAPARAHRLTRHRHVRTDNYYWLKDSDTPEVRACLEAENAYAASVLAPTAALQEQLYGEMLGRIQETDLSVPVRFGEWHYYSRTETGSQYPVHARKPALPDGSWSADAAEEVLLDENTEAQGKAFYEVGDYEISPSGRYLAWTEDTRGERSYKLRIRDLARKRGIRLTHKGVVSLAWAEDEDAHGLTLFFVTEDTETRRAHKLWRQHLGEKTPVLLFEEKDERFNLLVFKTRSRGLIIASSASHTTSEARFIAADRPQSRWRIARPRRAGTEYELDHHGADLYLRSNDAGPNFRLLRAPLERFREGWEEVLAHREDVVLESVELYRDWMVATERRDGVPALSITSLADNTRHDLAFDDPTCIVELEDLPEWDSPVLRYTTESLGMPEAIHEYDPRTRQSRLLKQQEVLGGFDPQAYVSSRLHAVSADGTAIPVSLIHRRDLALDGSAPLWLEAYGAYGICNDPWFSTTRLSLLDRGWVFAIAHVRGGGDLGQRWHEAGKMELKPNSFTDCIQCGRELAARGYTAPGRILVNGGSAGGLLVGAVLNLAPELFGAAILEVPFLDVVTTMLDPALPLTVGEYEEWGNPGNRTDYHRMLAWSPYDNLAPRHYPPILVEAGLHDTQVMIHEPAKYVAKLRTLKQDDNPLLFITAMEAGHGGASGRYDSLRERARQLAFALACLG